MENNVIDKIVNELESTSALVAHFRNSEQIPAIEKDIILSKLRALYELILLSNKQEPLKDEKAPSPKSEPVLIPEETVTPQNTQKVTITETVPVNEAKPKEIIVEEVHTSVIPVSSIKTVSSVKKEILAERFQTRSFLNEALAQYQNMQDVSRKLQNHPLSDISSAINLNEKFLFIRQLFNNDSTLYQNTIEKINNAGSFNEAVRYLDENFKWDFNDPLVQNLLELIRRRYINH